MENDTKILDIKDFILPLGALALVSIALLTKDPVLGALGLLATGYAVYASYRKVAGKNEEFIDYLEHMNEDFDQLTKHAIFSMPFPLVIADDQDKIVWYNTPFIKLFKEENSLIGSSLNKIVDLTERKKDHKEETAFSMTLEDRTYTVYPNEVETKSSDRKNLKMYYWVDTSRYEDLKKFAEDNKPVVAIVEVDNHDEAMDSIDSNLRPMVQAKLDSTISQYFHEVNAILRKFDQDTYLAVMSQESFVELKKRRFDLLDIIRSLDFENILPLTLSIGVSRPGLTYMESYKEADTSLDVALGRGGDQAVVRIHDSYEFFGGKSKAVEKRNKVKARVIGVALRQLIDRSRRVFVMGHGNADMDAIGSGIGVLRAVANRGKEGYLVLNKSNPSIDNLLNRMDKEQPSLRERFVTGAQAQDMATKDSLLIMVDNHKPSFTEHPALVDIIPNIVVIGHHRRGKEFVDNPVLSYVEPYASSTSELVTEMLTYMSDDFHLTNFEADALMSGIVVDTKNFTYHTGVRTFEAASNLRRAGADMSKVRVLFEDDYDTILARAEVVHNAKIYFDYIAVSYLDRQAANSVLVAAQAANELLDIHGIKASFVLTKKEKTIHISGRSLGELSVQLILEKIGGGGHLNMAGAQIETDSLDEAKDQLLHAIEEYLEEGAEV
ncbi:phosphoesterase [Tissierellia bacterium S5-A11]|nr:phosphoesterase [Tissierellia bacterium S5-A11]